MEQEEAEAILEKAEELYQEEAMDSFSGKEDAYGHIWGVGWEDSDRPNPGFGGTQDIYGGYVDQCDKCGMYGYEFEKQICGKKVR